jgi:EmrB/QacA subfamily drug resistance transporter
MHLTLDYPDPSVELMEKTTSERLSLLITCLAVVTLQAIVAGINLALPKLATGSLHPSGSQLVWIVDTYVLVFAALLIPAGALGDRIGRKGVLISGLVLFAVANLISATAPNVAMLQTGRALAGAAAALAQPATLALLLHATRPERRPAAIAMWTAAMGAGGMAGNLIAGTVLRWADWPALFLVFVPAGLLLAAGVALVVPKAPRRDAALDPIGTVLLTGGLFALLYGIIEGPDRGWTSAAVLGGFGAGLLLICGFVAYAVKAAHPVLDPRVFRQASVRAGAIGVGVGFLALFGLFFVNAQFLQTVKGYPTLVTAFAISPAVVGMAIMARRAGALSERFGARRLVGAGLGMIAAGLLLLSTINAQAPYAVYAVYLFVLSLGLGACAAPLTGAVLDGLPAGSAGLGSGINSASRELGAAIGVAVIGTVLNAGHAQRSAHDFTQAMALGYRILALILVLATVAVVAMWPARVATPEPEKVPA